MSRSFIASAVLGILLGACAAAGPAVPYGYDDLTGALREAGVVVGETGTIDQEFFSVQGRRLAFGGQEIQVFEYEDEAARQAESELIQSDGAPNPTTMVMWIDQPNFWAKDRLIVLYVGQDAATIERLSGVLGGPLTEE